MAFDPGLTIGEKVTNQELGKIFKVGNMGGMRRSKKTGTLVIISDMTKKFYHDKWKDGALHYTGMGKHGDQTLSGNQNKTLFDSKTNGVAVYLFEVLKKTEYTYRGRVELVADPYQTTQPDDEGRVRKVWMFPLAPVEDEDLENPDPARIARLSFDELVRRSRMTSGPREPKISQTTVYHRDEYLKEEVKRIAEGKCQLCGNPAPFIDNYGEPFLEEHHVKRLADGGTDTIDNVVAICPNCHRKIHILNDEADIKALRKAAAKNEERLKHIASEYTDRFIREISK